MLCHTPFFIVIFFSVLVHFDNVVAVGINVSVNLDVCAVDSLVFNTAQVSTEPYDLS